MKKLGLGKKKDGDEESTRSALFGRSKNKTPNPQANPYANLPTQADAYNQAKAKAGVPGYTQRGPSPAPPQAQQSGHGGMNGYPDEKKGGYGGMDNGSSRNGGADKYGSGESSAPAGGSRYVGGYGGMGPVADADDNRDALFGGAKDRVQKQNNQQVDYGQPPPYEEGQSGDQQGGYGSSSNYGDRQLSAEEEEEEDVQATKQQMRFIKQQDVSSTRNALRVAAQAEESG